MKRPELKKNGSFKDLSGYIANMDRYATSLERNISEIAKRIHYPECWDTAAYPTVFDALTEQSCNPQCCTKAGE